jgi:transcriptional regulator
MYVAKLNVQEDMKAIEKYISENSFAALISGQFPNLNATHVPLILGKENENLVLYGHIAKPNMQSKDIESGSDVLAIFMDRHTYISSSWYDHVNVPTWNYMAVHLYGIFKVLSEKETVQALHDLVNKYEEGNPKPFHIDQMGEDKFKRELRGITSFKIEVNRVEANWKLSQNRDDKNHEAIIQKLRERGDEMSLKIALEMDNNRKL